MTYGEIGDAFKLTRGLMVPLDEDPMVTILYCLEGNSVLQNAAFPESSRFDHPKKAAFRASGEFNRRSPPADSIHFDTGNFGTSSIISIAPDIASGFWKRNLCEHDCSGFFWFHVVCASCHLDMQRASRRWAWQDNENKSNASSKFPSIFPNIREYQRGTNTNPNLHHQLPH